MTSDQEGFSQSEVHPPRTAPKPWGCFHAERRRRQPQGLQLGSESALHPQPQAQQACGGNARNFRLLRNYAQNAIGAA